MAARHRRPRRRARTSLGGHLKRKGDGMPGVRTLWRGLRDLALLTVMSELHHR